MALKEYVKHFLKVIYWHSVHPPRHPLSAGGWVSYQIFKKGDLTGSQLLEEGYWKKGGNCFLAGGGRDHSFYVKNKLKSEILNDKKLQSKMFICHN